MIRLLSLSVVLLALGCAAKRGPAQPMTFHDAQGNLVKCRMEKPIGSNIAQRVCEQVPDSGTPPTQPNIELIRPRVTPVKGG